MVEEPQPCGRRALLRRGAAAVGSVSVLAGCLSAPDLGEPMASDVQSKTHVHHAAPATSTDGSVETTTQSGDADEYVLQEGGVRWDSFPVETVVGIGTVPDGVSTSAARAAITAAFETWNDVSGVGPVFAPPTFDDTLSEVTAENGTNEFVWSGIDDGSLGRATVYWDDQRRLEEVDVRLNPNRSWTTDPNGSGAYDIQSLATHELGHHGLDDVTDSAASEQTMYHVTEPGSTEKRTLAAGDIAGWQAAYGGRI